jgi:hypothetical protein
VVCCAQAKPHINGVLRHKKQKLARCSIDRPGLLPDGVQFCYSSDHTCLRWRYAGCNLGLGRPQQSLLDGVAVEGPDRCKTQPCTRGLGPNHYIAVVRFKGEVIHNPSAAHPCTIPFRTRSAKLFRFPLRHRDRRGAIGTHKSVANETSLCTKCGKAVCLNLAEDPFRFRRVEIDVPAGDGYPQISRRSDLFLLRQHAPQGHSGKKCEPGWTCNRSG